MHDMAQQLHSTHWGAMDTLACSPRTKRPFSQLENDAPTTGQKAPTQMMSKRPCFAAIRTQGLQLPKFATFDNQENVSPTSTNLSFNMDITHNTAISNMNEMDMHDERLSQLSEQQMRELYGQYHVMRTGLGPEY